jgi:hypothetical protein
LSKDASKRVLQGMLTHSICLGQLFSETLLHCKEKKELTVGFYNVYQKMFQNISNTQIEFAIPLLLREADQKLAAVKLAHEKFNTIQ